ncbi:hypothetical protein E2C01_038455 [Portunus trituberculatus]|uniref:Uncharacterized protein n=1 Tax=Portunus trituberculatus TaxID=210409 RepID=A0A5B7FGT5_PORTR|nr:hypothetical protein [Portunus trituberculatus]
MNKYEQINSVNNNNAPSSLQCQCSNAHASLSSQQPGKSGVWEFYVNCNYFSSKLHHLQLRQFQTTSIPSKSITTPFEFQTTSVPDLINFNHVYSSPL